MRKRRRLVITSEKHHSTSRQPQSEQEENDGAHVANEPQLEQSFETEESGQPSESHDRPRKVRGPTKMLHIWDLPSGNRVNVKFFDGQPIKNEAVALTRFIGSMIRRPQFAPINYVSWHYMPKGKIDEMWSTIESKFKFLPQLTEEIKHWVVDNMNQKWRQWKHELKAKGFDETLSVDEMVERLSDDRVDRNQYRDLVKYWCSEKSKKIAETNTQNRDKLDEPHCTGTKSFARLIDEKTEENGGIIPTRAEIYIDSRTRNNGTIVNAKAAEVVEKLKTGLSECENSHDPRRSNSWEGDVYSQVKGPEKKGRVRCVGKQLTSSNRAASTSSSMMHDNQESELKNLQGVVFNLVTFIQNQYPEQNIADIIGNVAGGEMNIGNAQPRSPSTSRPNQSQTYQSDGSD